MSQNARVGARFLKSVSGYRATPLYVCNPKNIPALRAKGLHIENVTQKPLCFRGKVELERTPNTKQQNQKSKNLKIRPKKKSLNSALKNLKLSKLSFQLCCFVFVVLSS